MTENQFERMLETFDSLRDMYHSISEGSLPCRWLDYMAAPPRHYRTDRIDDILREEVI